MVLGGIGFGELGTGKLGSQGHGHVRWDEEVDIAPESADFLDQTGTDIREFLSRHQKDRLKVGFEFPVHQCELELKLKVRHRAEPPDKGDRFFFFGKIDQQAFERFHHNVGDVLSRLLNQIHPFGERKESLLGAVFGHADDQFIKNTHSSAEHIKVTIGDGIKASGVNDLAHEVRGL